MRSNYIDLVEVLELDILELAIRRKSVRSFSSESVSLEDVLGALEVAAQAPSGANRQPWRFLILTDPDLRFRVREACEKGEKDFYDSVDGEFREWLLAQGLNWRKPFLEEAPLLVVVLMDEDAPYARESVWVAVGFLQLALEERSLSTLTYTPSDTYLPLRELDAPEGFKLEAILPVGFPSDT
jgi:nitroreductase